MRCTWWRRSRRWRGWLALTAASLLLSWTALLLLRLRMRSGVLAGTLAAFAGPGLVCLLVSLACFRPW